MHVDITYFSDTHSYHKEVKVKSCDILICGGDITKDGEESSIRDFFKWFNRQPCSGRIMVAGNHDKPFDKDFTKYMYASDTAERPMWLEELLQEYMRPENNCFYLEGECCDFFGIKIWGGPYTMLRRNKSAFKLDNAVEADKIYGAIPDDTDIILSHGPAFNRLDEEAAGKNLGSEQLLRRIHEINPTYVLSGHVHEDRGYMLDPIQTINTLYFNGAICDANNKPVHPAHKIKMVL